MQYLDIPFVDVNTADDFTSDSSYTAAFKATFLLGAASAAISAALVYPIAARVPTAEKFSSKYNAATGIDALIAISKFGDA